VDQDIIINIITNMAIIMTRSRRRRRKGKRASSALAPEAAALLSTEAVLFKQILQSFNHL